jgi:hypothetical protein
VKQPVDAWDLRRIFNESGIWDAVLEGTAMIEIRDRVSAPSPKNKQPPGTLSVTSFIHELHPDGSVGRKVAFVHYYELPDGTINNGAGVPDPKWCLDGGVFYTLRV